MKKHIQYQLLTLLFLAVSLSTFAQVGVGTTTPEGILDVVSTDSGVILPRVANTAAVTSAVNGMMVFDISSNCVKSYENDVWSDCLSRSFALVSKCDQNGFEGVIVNGVALTDANFSVTISNNGPSSADFTFAIADLVLSGVSGISVSSVSPTSVSLAEGESQLVTYNLSGTPASTGTLTGTWSNESLSCTDTYNVTGAAAVFLLPYEITVVSVDTESPFSDIQGVIDNSTNQIEVDIPYSYGIQDGSYDAYTSAVVNSAEGTGEGGDSNGFRISFPASELYEYDYIPVTIIVDGDGSFDVKKVPIGVTKTIATFDFQLNGNSLGDVILKVEGKDPCPTDSGVSIAILGAPTTTVCGGSSFYLYMPFPFKAEKQRYANTYEWSASSGTFDNAHYATPKLTLPSAGGSVTVNLTVTNDFCRPDDIAATPVVIDVAANLTSPAIAVTGVECLDVEMTETPLDPLSPRLATIDDFTNLVYTVGDSTGATGFIWSWVSNPGNNGTINSGGSTNTVDVTFNKTLEAVGTYILQVEMTGLACGSMFQSIKIEIRDGNCGCRVPISDTETRAFSCHNFGADFSLDPHLPSVGLQGAYIQWGKRGPINTRDSMMIDWQTAEHNGPLGFAAAPTASNPNDGAIINWSTTVPDNAAWNIGTEAAPEKTDNNPCPSGFRVPTRNEWVGVIDNNTATRIGTFSDSSANYAAILHFGPDSSTHLLSLPASGGRDASDGTIISRGEFGWYWSSTSETDTTSYLLSFSDSTLDAEFSGNRLAGYSVRCVEGSVEAREYKTQYYD